MLALRKLLNKPKLDDGSLLSLFYYCDIAVNHQMQELNNLMRTSPDDLDRRATLIRQLKEAQHSLMNVIMSIADKAIPDKRAPRDFRVKYPDDILLDQINGPIWFGAECIAAGSHIANHEVESTELRPFATHLSKVVTKLRQALRVQSVVNRDIYTQKIKDLLVMFDELWVDFEFRYISLMCNVKTESQYYHQQDVVVLFCESTLRAIKLKNLSYDMIEMMDPSAMFAIPRLAILCGLVVYPEGPLDPSKPSKDMPHCFRAYRQLLIRIKELLGHLDQKQLETLEHALCSSEGLGTLEQNKLKAEAANKKRQQNRNRSDINDTGASGITPAAATTISSDNTGTSHEGLLSASIEQLPPSPVVPNQATTISLSQNHRSLSSNLDSRGSTATVFEPHTLPEVIVEIPVSSGTAETPERSVALEEVEPFPPLGINQAIENELPAVYLPSITQTSNISLNSSTLSLNPSLTSPSHDLNSFVEKSPKPSKKSKPKGPAGFPSVEDLMHRLFLGISGVADQLQTNHAKDLRVILKSVFTVCQSEPETPDHVIQTIKNTSKNKFSSVDELEPCTPEPQSPLITASQRFRFPIESLTIEQTPSWIPDSDSLLCSVCTSRFSWRRRRHHCRCCGNVVCSSCSPHSLPLFQYGIRKPVRVCTNCYITQLNQVSSTLTGITGQPLQV